MSRVGSNSYIKFFDKDLNECVGSDGVFILDGRNSLDTAINDAYERSDKMKGVQHFGGFQIRTGTGHNRFSDYRCLTSIIKYDNRKKEPVSYCIIRMYAFKSRSAKIIKTGLTLEEAKAHCHDPETCSTTTSDKSHEDTHGPWFDGFRAEVSNDVQ